MLYNNDLIFFKKYNTIMNFTNVPYLFIYNKIINIQK